MDTIKPTTPDAERTAGSLHRDCSAAPVRGDKYYWHTGGAVTVVRVDGSMTVVQTPAGNLVNVPTGTLMTKPKAQQNNLIGRKDFLAIGYYGPNRESLFLPFHGRIV